MYLTKQIYIGNQDKTPEEQAVIDIPGIKQARVTEITERIVTWHKANQIHRWFVANIQEGNDDCRAYYVSPEQLVRLLEVCQEVQKHPDKAQQFLPTEKGFFFGSTDYDTEYFADIDKTIEQLTALLTEPQTDEDYKYQSSW